MMFSSDPTVDFVLWFIFQITQVGTVLFISWSVYAAALAIFNSFLPDAFGETKALAMIPSMASVSAAVGVAIYLTRIL